MADASVTFPTFRYHPHALATGSVEASSVGCQSCGRARGYIYVGPTYSEDDEDGSFCPWCIGDGTANRELGVEFNDVGWGVPEDVPAAVLEELSGCTPGFETWQQARWLYHCADGCAFLGQAGRPQLDAYPGAVETLIRDYTEEGGSAADAAEFVAGLSAGGESTAYVFQCLHCGTYLAFADSA